MDCETGSEESGLGQGDCRTPKSEIGCRNPSSGIGQEGCDSAFRNPNSAIGTPQSELRNPQSEIDAELERKGWKMVVRPKRKQKTAASVPEARASTYQCFADARPATKPRAKATTYFDGVLRIVRELVRRGEQVLVFAPTRKESEDWAGRLSRELGLMPAEELIAELADCEPSYCREALRGSLSGGVAYHNADVPLDMRGLIEQGIRSGAVRVAVATSTLAQGVNLYVDNVVIVPLMVRSFGEGGRPRRVMISLELFRNEGGRAGRVRAATEGGSEGGAALSFGRAIVVARNAQDVVRLKERLFSGQPAMKVPEMTAEELECMVLDMVNGCPGMKEQQLHAALMRLHTGMCLWAKAPEAFLQRQRSALQALETYQLVRGGLTGFSATRLGRAAAQHGVQAATVRHLVRCIQAWSGKRSADELSWYGPPDRDGAAGASITGTGPDAAGQPDSSGDERDRREACVAGEVTPFDMLLAISFTADVQCYPLSCSKDELDEAKYSKLLAARSGWSRAALPDPLNGLFPSLGGLTATEEAAIKKAMIAEHWISDKPTEQVEKDCGEHMGSLANFGGHLAWISQALGACAEALDAPAALSRAAYALAERLAYGVTEEGLELARLRVRRLTRGCVTALVRERLGTVADIAAAGPGRLERVVPASVARAVRERCSLSAEWSGDEGRPRRQDACVTLGGNAWPDMRIERAAAAVTPGGPGSSAPVSMVAEGEPDSDASRAELFIDCAHPGELVFRGRLLRLSLLPWELLIILAMAASRIVSRIEITEKLWLKDTGAEGQNIDHHNRALREALAQVCGIEEARKLLRTPRGLGLELALLPEVVWVEGGEEYFQRKIAQAKRQQEIAEAKERLEKAKKERERLKRR